MSEHKARVLLSPSREARGRPFVIHGSARLDPGRYALQSLDASAPAIGRVLFESDSTQTRSLEGRPLDMYSSLRLPDRSRLGQLNPRPRPAPAVGVQKRRDVWLLRAPRAGVTTSPPPPLAQELAQKEEGPMRGVTREVEKWKTDRL
jgi:hypothetical protein